MSPQQSITHFRRSQRFFDSTSQGSVWAVDYGVVADGSTDNEPAITSMIENVDAGTTIIFPNGTINVNDEMTVTKAMNLFSYGGSAITATVSGKSCFNVTASNVIFDGLDLIGLNGATTTTTKDTNENAIDCLGSSAASPITGIIIKNCFIQGWDGYGILQKWCNDVRIINNRIDNIHYAGVGIISGIGGVATGNHISNINGTTAQNAYGLFLSRAETDSLSTDPRSESWSVNDNVIINVPEWEGLDTHGGKSITFSNNVIKNTHIGIAVGSSDKTSQVPTWAPIDVVVSGNVIDSTVTDSSRIYGIAFTGASGTIGNSVEQATGTIIGNVIRGHGDDTDGGAGSGAIWYRDTMGLVISGNFIIEPSPYGIVVYHSNDNFSITGNTIIDPFSATSNAATGIEMRSTDNVGRISGNIFGKDSKSATSVGFAAINITSATNTSIQIGNNFENGFTHYITGGGEEAGQIANTLGQEASLVSADIGDATLNFFQRTSALRAFIQYQDSGDLFVLDADGPIVLSPNNTESLRLQTDQRATFANDIEMGSGGPRLIVGSGTPEGNVSADVGSIFMRTDGSTGTSVYVKESGTGTTLWVGK